MSAAMKSKGQYILYLAFRGLKVCLEQFLVGCGAKYELKNKKKLYKYSYAVNYAVEKGLQCLSTCL